MDTASMLNAERYGQYPVEAIDDIWAGIDFPENKRDYPIVTRFLDLLRSMYQNGGAWFGSFRVPNRRSFKWWASRGRLDEIEFFDRFWRTTAVLRQLAELSAPDGFRCKHPFVFGNAFTLDGEFAAAIHCGGAYGCYKGTAAEAKSLGQDVCRELIGDRFNEVYVYTNHAPWCDLFDGIIDRTWVLLDKRNQLFHVICASDVD